MVMGKFPLYRHLGLSLQGDVLQLQFDVGESVVQAERTACTMDHENKPEHEVQFSWMSSWSDVRMRKHLLLRDWDTIAKFYADKAVGLGKGASYSSAPPCGASQELTVS